MTQSWKALLKVGGGQNIIQKELEDFNNKDNRKEITSSNIKR